MLKVEYLKDGSSDCPLIRIFGKDINAYKLLRNQISLLINHKVDVVHIQNLKEFELINIDSIDLYVDKEKIGIQKISDREFECRLKIDGWESWQDVISLLEPFCTQVADRSFQWLVDHSKIKLLISSDGLW